MEHGSPVLSDVIGWRPTPGGLNVEVSFSTPAGEHHALEIDSAALLHLVPIAAAATQPWSEDAENEGARTLRSYMDVDRFVLGLDTARPGTFTLTLGLTSDGSLTFHFDRRLALDLMGVLQQVLRAPDGGGG